MVVTINVVLLFDIGCQMKCHKDDIDKVDLIQPCVVGMCIHTGLWTFVKPFNCFRRGESKETVAIDKE